MTPREEAAHRYSEFGWPVFPVAPGAKTPTTSNGFLDATTSHRQIESWWRARPAANVAIATGAPGPDVVDVDVHKNGSGFGAWNELKRAGLVPDAKAIVRTPSGGMHAYFTGTDQRNGHIPDRHIDFRAQGGYVVAPPSVVGGKPYYVVQHQLSAATFDWPAAREHLAPAPSAAPAPRAAHAFPDGPRDVSHLARWVASQPEGNRNAGLFWAANRAVEAGDTESLVAIGRAAREAGLDDREIERTIRSALRGPERPFEHHPAPVLARDEPRTDGGAMTEPAPRLEADPAQREPEAGS
jgi:Bifunctional DNA primase/polymerase, N-terminal